MSEIGRISGQLLFDNLTREGTDLAFETSLLYLNVNAKYIGVNSDTPFRPLTVNGESLTTDLIVDTQFTNSVLTITTNQIANDNGDIIVTATGLNPVITAPILQTDNLQIRSNLISSLAGSDINLDTNGGKLNIRSDVYAVGNIHATGDITWDGNIVLGNSPTDTVTFDAEINSDILPSQTNIDSLGSVSSLWQSVYTPTYHTRNIEGIEYSLNANIILLDDGFTLTTDAGDDLTDDPVTTQLTLSGNGQGVINLNNIKISGNNISNRLISGTDTERSVEFTPNGLGNVKITGTGALVLPKGVGVSTVLTVGATRYNNTNNVFEGYTNAGWASIGDVRSVDYRTYITPELTSGYSDNTLRFYVNTLDRLEITSNGLATSQVNIGDIQITDKNISTVANSSNLTLTTTGSGVLKVADFTIKGSEWTNTTTDAVTVISTTNSSSQLNYAQFVGSAVKLPSGNNSQYGTQYETGSHRFNTDTGILEVYNGTAWQPAVGNTESYASIADVEAYEDLYIFIFG